MSIKNNFPSQKPSLVLDFTNSKTLDARTYFSRDSQATYVGPNKYVTYASEDQPRFDHDPITGECLGLLIEDARQNLMNNNVTYSSGSWAQSGLTATLNQGISPDGKNNAVLLEENASNGQHLFFQTIGGGNNTIGDKYTFSVWAKAGTRNVLGLTAHGQNYQWFNLSTGVPYSSPSDFTNATMTPYPNGWYRCSCTIERVNIQETFYILMSNDVDVTQSYQGVLGESLYIWGPQVEKSDYVSSWMPCPDSTYRTRFSDACSFPGTVFNDVYNQTGSTIVATYKYSVFRSSYQKPVAIFLSPASHYGIGAQILTQTNPRFLVYSGQGGSFSSTQQNNKVIEKNRFYTSAMSWTNGGSSYMSTDGEFPISVSHSHTTVPVQISIGNTLIGAEYLEGILKKIVLYPTALSNDELQTLSANQ